MTNKECPFCRIPESALVVHETANTYSIISKNPINTHHIPVIPKAHYESFSEMSDEIASEIFVHAKMLSSAIHSICQPDGMAHLSDDDFSGARYNLVKHYKFHVFPRYRNDGIEQKWSRVPDPGDDGRSQLAQSLREALT
jgi:histidine triad (HIT) family protein